MSTEKNASPIASGPITGKVGVHWFRNDLRIQDNPALVAACKHQKVLLIYIAEPDTSEWSPGQASDWWLHHSLQALQESLYEHGKVLHLFQGSPTKVFERILAKIDVGGVYWNRRYEPDSVDRDRQVKLDLLDKKICVQSFKGSLLAEPWENLKNDGNPYLVYTPYWKKFLSFEVSDCLKAPYGFKNISSVKSKLHEFTVNLEDLELLPSIGWDYEMKRSWQVGENAAQQKLAKFLKNDLDAYSDARDIPGKSGTSLLSPHLHFGEISPKMIWHKVASATGKPMDTLQGGALQYAKEVVWREFAYSILFHNPNTTNEPLQKKFSNFPWSSSKKNLKLWQKGKTGYPIVDAGMRELWATGYMHNRVRMVVASFLVKHLRINWVEGAKWFWDCLLDADLASNSLGWQWAAGCGADAAPYFRVFNPILQGEKFDKRGEYVKRWCPELKDLPPKYLHKPWEAPQSVLVEAGVKLGDCYPLPIVDHKAARLSALDAYKKIK